MRKVTVRYQWDSVRGVCGTLLISASLLLLCVLLVGWFWLK